MGPEEYCSRKVAPPGSDLYYALLFLPEEQRAAIEALHAFQAEVREVIEECTDPGVARLKLQWWREESGRIARGEAHQPVARALQAVHERHSLRHGVLGQIIDTAERGLDEPPGASPDGLIERQRAIGARVWRLCAETCGICGAGTLQAVDHLGAALGEGALLRNLRTMLRRPGLEPVAARTAATAGGPRLEERIPGLRRDIASAQDAIPRHDRLGLLGAITLARIEMATLEEVERDGCRVLDRHVTLTPLRKLWIARRTRAAERRRSRRADA